MDVIAGSSIGLSGEELSIRMCSMRGGDVGWRGTERKKEGKGRGGKPRAAERLPELTVT